MTGSCGRPRRPSPSPCDIRAEVRNRNGTPRWWCRVHGSPAWGPDGQRLERCPGLNRPPLEPTAILRIDPGDYPGGIGIWGAVDPVFNTGPCPTDRGIHVHARRSPGAAKTIDATYQSVVCVTPKGEFTIDADDAVAFLVASVFNLPLKALRCPHCGEPHADLDLFAAQPHRKHQCNQCGRAFFDPDGEPSISNPCAKLRDQAGHRTANVVDSDRTLHLNQADFGGLAIWGSNPAIVWTATTPEDAGVHLHAWTHDGEVAIDETFGYLTIDGVALDIEQVRTLMVQRSLHYLWPRVVVLACHHCGEEHFDTGPDALRPTASHTCRSCGEALAHQGRLHRVVSNPILSKLCQLAQEQ